MADHLARIWSAESRADTLLFELDFGRWEARLWSDIANRDRDAYERWMRDWRFAGPPGGESPSDLEGRARRWLDALDPNRSHALVAHAGFVRALYVVLTGMAWEGAMGAEVPYLRWSSWTSLEAPGPGRAIA